MTLHEYVAQHCPEGPAQLRRLILERTGKDIPYAYVWKWCDTKRLCAVSVENAQVLHAATQGKCSLTELQSLKTIRARLAGGGKRKSTTPPSAAKAKRKPKPRPRSAAAKLHARIAELEAQLAAATPSDAA